MMNVNKTNRKGRFVALFSNQKNHGVALFAHGAISVMLLGQYHYWSACIGGVFLVILLLHYLLKNRELSLSIALPNLFIHIVVLFYLISVVWALDKGMAALGFFKYLTVSLFIILLDTMGADREKLLEAYAYFAGVSVIVCCLLSIIPSFRNEVFYNGRLGGTFLYANSYGLFLLLAMVIVSTKDNLKKADYLFCIIYGLGIVLTGSRSIFLVSVGVLIILLFVNWRAVAASFIGILLAAFVTLSFFSTGGMHRSVDISLSSGELLNRLAYYHDGVKLIRLHPFGLGHSGWWYAQTSIQSALYNVRLVHNWALQLALDAGIVPAVLLAASVLIVAFHKKSGLRKRLLLLLIFGHSLIDFDLAFLPVAYIGVLALPVDSHMVQIAKKGIIAVVGAACVIMLLLFVWLGSATFLSFIGMDTAAVKLYPIYTEAMEKILVTDGDPDEALVWAERIMALNPHVHDAYDVKARVYASKGAWGEAVEMKHEFILRSRLHGSDYDELLMYIHYAIIVADANGAEDTVGDLIALAMSIPGTIDAVNASLSPIAYRIRHKPTLYLSDDSLRFLEYLSDYIEYSQLQR